MLDCAGGRFVRFSGFGFLPLYSFSENLACGYANWSIYPTFHGRKAYRRNKISPLWLLFPFSWVLGSLQSSSTFFLLYRVSKKYWIGFFSGKFMQILRFDGKIQVFVNWDFDDFLIVKIHGLFSKIKANIAIWRKN